MISNVEDIRDCAILVVDDIQSGITFLERILTSEGLRVQSATDGLTALKLIKESPPDLVMLDVMMPSIDGFQILEQLRKDPATADLPIILTTALDQPKEIVHGLELGANDYLTKPTQPEILVARVKTQLKLKRAQDQRRKLDAIKDKFLQIAAHDIQAPLGNISIGIHLMAEQKEMLAPMWEGFEDVLGIMRSAANSMQAIVSDFLDHDAMRSGQIKLDIQPVEVEQTIASTIRQFEAYAAQKRVTLLGDLGCVPLTLQGDPDRIAQVVSNLIGNAIKFSKAGDQVEVRARADGDWLRVEVSDDGPGIPSEDMPRLFQEFVKLTNKPTGGEKSSGLGLAISRKLVELHGGHIGVDSSVGGGSTFWFEIPLSDS